MKLIGAALLAAVAVVLGQLATHQSPLMLGLGIGAICLSSVVFFDFEFGIALLIFSMMLSPEINLGSTGAGASHLVVVRYDDFLLLILFAAWVVRNALDKNLKTLHLSELSTPMLVYTFICLVATLLGILRGNVTWMKGSLYTLKYLEYFVLYFIAYTLTTKKERIWLYLKLGGLTALVVTVYGYWYYLSSGGKAAIAPFEAPINVVSTEMGEPGSLGGYYLVIFGVLFGMMIHLDYKRAIRLLLPLGFMLPVFLVTFSRASYLGIMGMVSSILIFNEKRRLFVMSLITICCVSFFAITPIREKVMARVAMTYQASLNRELHDFHFLGKTFRLEDSAAQRVWTWQRVLDNHLPVHPLMGFGITGVGFEDSQYGLLLSETGLLGFFAFWWMIATIYLTTRQLFLLSNENWMRGLAMGLAVGLTGLLLDATTTNTFIIVRIMEPFWFLVAITDKLKDLLLREREEIELKLAREAVIAKKFQASR
jgi:hypothetical protein